MADELVAPLPGEDETNARRLLAAGVIAFAVVALAGETYAKWWPYGLKVAKTITTGHLGGSSILAAAGAPGAAPSWHGAWTFTSHYGLAIWPALAAAVLIGAGVEVLLPRLAVRRAFGTGDGWRSSAAGGLLALPCLMCTCCASPITVSLRRSKVPTTAALSYWLSNPLLNPVVLILLALVLPWPYVVVRIVIGAVLVFGIAPLVARLRPGDTPPAAPGPGTAEETSQPSSGGVAMRYVQAVGRLVVVLLPEYFVLVLALGAFGGWLLPLSHAAVGWGVGAVVVAAVAGTLLVIPTAGEIPIITGLVALGFPISVTGALLISLPALSLVSVAMVGRSLSWRVTATMAGAVAGGALAAGGLAALL